MSSNERQGSICYEDDGTGKKPRNNNDNFDYGSDDELPEEFKDRLIWRTDDPFADWKIVIIVTKPRNANNHDSNDGKEYIYNVRKCVLASGPRRSDYFVRLFDNDFSESHGSTSRIELNELQAKAFPEFLGYMYSTGQKMSFTTNNATALYALAKYFGARRLQNEAKNFCLKDMNNVDTCGTYYEHAAFLQEDRILEVASKFCCVNIEEINPFTSRLLHVPDPQFWLDLMKDRTEKGTISNPVYKVCARITMFCNIHAAILSPEIFKQLTDEKCLLESHIHPLLAVMLLDVERRIIGNDAVRQQGELSSLQVRCVNAIARGDEEALRELHKEWARTILQNLSPLVLCEIIARGLLPPPFA